MAFDCAEASAELTPDLRQRLDKERAAGVRAGLLSPAPAADRRMFFAAAGAPGPYHRRGSAGLAPWAVPADLYWLFLADTAAPPAGQPGDPLARQPATGIWGAEAQAFVKWLNSITATSTGIEVRLPHHNELQDPAVAGDLERQLPPSVTSA